MAPPSAGEIATAVGFTIPAFFSDALDQVLQGEGNYIATGEPIGAVAQIGQAVARSACRRYASGEGSPTGPQSERYERACRPYLDLLNPGGSLGVANPFQGGQCFAISYDFQFTATSSPGVTSTTTQNSLGRIVGTFTLPPNAFGQIRYGFERQTSPGGFIEQVILGAAAAGTEPNPSISGVARVDAAPDDCGNPPPVVIPPRTDTDPFPPPFRFNPIPGVDVGVDVQINPDGSITFDIGTGDVTVNPFSDAADTGVTPSDLAPGGGDAGSPANTGAGGASEGEAPPGQELVGVLVEVLEAPVAANTFDNVAAQVYRGFGYVRLGYPGRLGLDISGGTVLAPQFFHSQQRGLTNWAVRANIGFNLRTTPYYREIS